MVRAKYTRPLITKAELKHVRSLQQKKYRDSTGLFLVQGPKLVAELLACDGPVEALFVTEEAQLKYNWPSSTVLPAHELDRLGTLDSGVEAIAVVRKSIPEKFGTTRTNELILVLDGVRDPGNLGTLLRIADWFGIARVVCSPDCVEVWNPKCVQASMGALFRVEVHSVELGSFLADQERSGTSLYVASMEGQNVFDVALKRPAALIMGSESHGVSDAVRTIRNTLIAIPGSGNSESLNVAMAASALCMEFTRQLRLPR
ncbi:MAG: RNA methyltransferase [Flavobacteriales bacterium]|nr:RNA methyltransferase [Flavobacteriales bacterium]MBK9537114.1 RNA methyltransferase [Flavobacteriales bacterium]MBP9138013.1 RNA methyltransferase [Flavobacteriales bacterium]HQX29505.1 RNA methyltransferase [Flavobacteriales bacterium]HQX39087.1 RNA methyltransferase [Flavobacteriales bacterium]